MKRIVFLTKRKHPAGKRLCFVLRLLARGVRVSFDCKGLEKLPENTKGTLLITDDAQAFEMLSDRGVKVIAAFDSMEEYDCFKGAKYLLMDALEAEYEYFENIYRRFNDIPWEPVKTKRLILRETTVEDVDVFYEMYKDPELTRFNEPLYENPEEEKKYALEYKEKVYEVQGFGTWTIVRKKDNRVIGRAGINVRSGFDGYEIGFVVGTAYQRQGYATEAIKGILEYARSHELAPVCAMVMHDNTASINLLTKLGFSGEEETRINGILYRVMVLEVGF